MTIADTDVLIDYLAGRNEAAAQVATELALGTLVTTVVTRFELLAGARTPRQQETIQQLLEVVPALSLDPASADRAAQVRRTLELRGEPIGMGDSLIAGIVLQNGGALMTRNRRHFERIEGLPLLQVS
ncbi:MAG TPA: type II toxin-antitoxin system VapC family toxin [Thermoanaerobaculia bacterium]|nr:type II toxin-antitoxin system VapC family toxin [Thermoanaerobaculia bacterium]